MSKLFKSDLIYRILSNSNLSFDDCFIYQKRLKRLPKTSLKIILAEILFVQLVNSLNTRFNLFLDDLGDCYDK